MYHKDTLESNIYDTSCKELAQQNNRQAVIVQKTATHILEAIHDIIFQVNRSGIISEFQLSGQYPPLQSSTDMIGQNIRIMFPAQAEEKLTRGIALTLETGEMRFFEYEWNNADMSQWFEAQVTQVSPENVLIIAKNVSARRHSEACDVALLDIAIKVQEEYSLDEIIDFACQRIRMIFGVRLVWGARKKSNSRGKLFISGGNLEGCPQGIFLR